MSTKMKPKLKSKLKKDLNSEKKSKYFANKESNSLKTSIKESKNDLLIESRKRRKEETISSSDESAIGPKNWEQILANIREMRSSRTAVVDSMGAEKAFDETEQNPKNKRFQILISLMLSSQTKDETTYKTMQTLREWGLTVDHINQTSAEDLKRLINSVNFVNNKTKFIKKTALILRDEYDSDIPDTVAALLTLPGVGPKMAHLAMQIAWNQCTGIAVDTHVHRICNRLEWTESKTPEQTQKQLQLWFPRHLWNEINLLLVGFGQTICSPLRPKCGQCLNQKLCPFVSSELDF